MSETRKIRTGDGITLHTELWRPEGEVRFVVCIVHGQGEHVGRYDRIARELNAMGGLVFGPDHRGQGRSGGAPGYVDRFERYADDLLLVLRDYSKLLGEAGEPGKVPWFLWGHSMGGLITLIYLLDHERDLPLRGAVISSPLVGLAIKVGFVKQHLVRLVAKLLPRLPVPTGLDPATICRDPEEVSRYASDPRRVPPVTPSWAVAMEDATVRVNAEVRRLQLAMHWFVGTGDLICDHKATEDAFATLADPGGNDQSIRVWPGYYHELHNEPDEYREPVMAEVRGWLAARL
ncbi:MAG: lysophospholipase [Myxococcales bacterium]|nr:lysophospholipase [Myxococcales bacterium]